MATKIVIGRIGSMVISEMIDNYQASVVEMITTARKNIKKKFEQHGYNSDDVIFIEKLF